MRLRDFIVRTRRRRTPRELPPPGQPYPLWSPIVDSWVLVLGFSSEPLAIVRSDGSRWIAQGRAGDVWWTDVFTRVDNAKRGCLRFLRRAVSRQVP